jgi:hypothetical protein
MLKNIIPFMLIIIFLFLISVQAQGIPEELEIRGFTKYLLLDYEKKGKEEHFTFSNWLSKIKGDTITFIVVDGEVTGVKEELKDNNNNGFDI